MFEPELRRKAAEVADEVPESEAALAGAPAVEELAQMSREEAIAIITSAPSVPLPHRAALEARFGSLAHVRCHTGPAIAAALRALGAEAATFGNHVAFATSDPAVETVAHEMTHVAQAARAPQGEAADEAQAERVERGDDAALGELAETMPGGGKEPALRKKALVKDDVDPEDLEKKGDEIAGNLAPAKVTKAIAWNDKKWQGAARKQLLGYLRGEEEASGGFSAGDVEKVADIQAGAGVAREQCDGMIGDTTMAILLHAGLSLDLGLDAKSTRPQDVHLIFYPGEFEDIDAWKAKVEEKKKEGAGDPSFNLYRAVTEEAPEGTGRLYVKYKGNLVDVIDCRGGPPITMKDGTHSADPSKAGTYTLGKGQSHKTSSWYNSQIKWGAEIRARDDGEIEFNEGAGWKVATGSRSVLKDPMTPDDFYEGGELMTTWRKNDFGEKAYRVEGSPGLFVHTSPADEEAVLAGETPVLGHSHGCLHVNPAERKKLEDRGLLKGGATLTIKKYDVHLLPKGVRDELQGKEE